MGITATSWLRETRRLDLVVLDVAVSQPKVTSEVCVKDGTMALAQMQNLEKSCQHRQYSINQPKRQLSAQRKDTQTIIDGTQPSSVNQVTDQAQVVSSCHRVVNREGKKPAQKVAETQLIDAPSQLQRTQ